MKRRTIKKDRATSTLLSDWINNRARHYRLFSLPLLCAFAITCSNEPNILEQVKEKGELHVITLNSPTTYYQDEDTMAGPEYDLVNELADNLGVKLVVKAVSYTHLTLPTTPYV